MAFSFSDVSQMSQSRAQRPQAPITPPRPSTAGLYPLCLAQRPSNLRARIFKVRLNLLDFFLDLVGLTFDRRLEILDRLSHALGSFGDLLGAEQQHEN